MRKVSKVLLGTFFLLLVFSTLASISVVAVDPPDQVVEVPSSDSLQTKLQAQVRTQFRFRHRTQLTIRANQDVELDINCDAFNIGAKDFSIDVTCNGNLQMNMICTRDQDQLGLQQGYTYRVRNRNQHRYHEGFVVSIECNQTQLQAKLRIRATNENQIGTWAYYDDATSEWVPSPSYIEDGYLTTDTTHFSTWTVLVPDFTSGAFLGLTISLCIVGAVAVIAFVYVRKRK